MLRLILALALVITLLGCGDYRLEPLQEGVPEPLPNIQASSQPFPSGLQVYYWHDDARKVGCWVAHQGTVGLSIHCIADGNY